MGAVVALGLRLSTLKYHYFGSFFTYSVRRRACVVVDSSRLRHGVLDPRECGRERHWVAGVEGRSSGPRGNSRTAAPPLVRSVPSSCLSLPIRFEDTARRGV